MSSRRFHHRVRGRLLRLAVLVIMAVSLVAGTARAGSTYFFCSGMAEQRSEPCCQRHSLPASSITSTSCDCCHPVVAEALPVGVAPETPDVPPSPAVAPRAMVPTAYSFERAGVITPLRRARGRPPREVDRVRLMVFLN